MANIIVSRHPAAVAFIREQLPDFATARVVESATADDVRGNVVAGNIPLHLAALAAQVIAVEFDGAPPRGAEYGIAEMRAGGARLARYAIAPVKEPAREIRYDDGIGHRGRRSMLLVGKGDALTEFVGKAIPGIVAVAKADYTRNGKWSSTDYTLLLAPGAWTYVASQSWEEGEYFHGCNSVGDAVGILRKSGCAAPDEAVIAFLREKFPKTCARLDTRQAEIDSVR